MQNFKKTIIMSASALALLVATPVMANDATHYTAEEMPHVTQEDLKQGWEKTKQAVKETTAEVTNATEEALEETQKAMATTFDTITINERNTVAGMLGQPIYDVQGERVAKIHDILLDTAGEAKLIVLKDGDWTGLGKQVAYQYGVLTKTADNGDIITPLSEEMIDDAMAFEYAQTPQLVSARQLINSDLLDAEGNVIAQIENISLKNSTADQVILSFNQVLGMGGDKAAIAFKDITLKQVEGRTVFKLSANQTSNFENVKNSRL